ncbi:membrane integrity-associated transporter subunit PqiC [Luteolibacter algae]|uniref:Membrane integrity-associated transporter subunit PqiC n=1 Tax=Luteolibacter algae TaxID=454151 RepID=A0ABW5DDY8_9BACT
MFKSIALFCLSFLLLSCGLRTYPTFYTLSADGPSPSGGGIGVGVGPVILAEYVDRENLVIQTSPNKLELAENHLWAGDLDDSIARVLSINLGRRLKTGNIRTYPWQSDGEIDYQIAVDIREFVAGNDGYAHIDASWRIYALPSRKLVASATFIDKEAIQEEEYESFVSAQSRLLSRLSAEISNRIK